MATEVTPGPVTDWRAASTAGGGTALSTTSAVIGYPAGTRVVSITPRNFSGTAVAQLSLCPWVIVMKTSDLLVAEANLTDYTEAAQDGDATTSVVLSSIDTFANGDALYVGAEVPFRGADIDIDAANATASVITVKYWNGSAWADISDTDGTISGGASMAIDGQVTWTLPSDWVAVDLKTAGDTVLRTGLLETPLYWTRWEWSAALDSSTTLDHLIALNRSTAREELLSGQNQEFAVQRRLGGSSAIEGVMNTGTGNLIVNVAATGRFS